MNKSSSRSHAIFKVSISSYESGKEKKGSLFLVDLSGSENLERAGSSGERQLEASNINKGLLALGRVMKSLVENQSHVPFRDSKVSTLTKLARFPTR